MALRASISTHAREIRRRRIYATMATLEAKRRRTNSPANYHQRQRAHEKHLCKYLENDEITVRVNTIIIKIVDWIC